MKIFDGFFGRDPVLWATATRTIILVAVAFGLKWTPEQIAATMLAVEAILALLVHSKVVPTIDVKK